MIGRPGAAWNFTRDREFAQEPLLRAIERPFAAALRCDKLDT